MHVGPPKTATTYLQVELERWEEFLRTEDNVAYAGKYISKEGQERALLGVTGETALGPIVSALQDRTCQDRALSTATDDYPDCWARFLLMLEPYRSNGTSILVSDEDFTVRDISPRWELLHRDLSAGWNVVAVAAYRRWAEWLPSKKQQTYRWSPSKPGLNRWPEGRGKKCERTMDWIHKAVQSGPSSGYKHTAYVVDTISTDGYRIDTRVLDLHSDHGRGSSSGWSVRSNLFCNTLKGIVPNACAVSRTRDATERHEKFNARTQTEFYDALGTAAAAAGLLGGDISRFGRHKVALDIQRRKESVTNRTSLDFPLDCPTQSELEEVLNASLAVERNLARRGFLRVHRPSDHEMSFWNNTLQYCWINTRAVLAMEEWKEFFRQLLAEGKS